MYEVLLPYESFLVSFSTYSGFMFDIMIAELIFSARFVKKRHFLSKSIAVFLAELGLSVPVSYALVDFHAASWMGHALITTLAYLILLLVSLAGEWLLFAEDFYQIMLCGVTAYALQHLQSQLILLFYRPSQVTGQSLMQLFFWPVSKVVMLAVYGLAYRLLVKKNDAGSLHMKSNNVIFLSVITILMVLTLSSIRDYYQDESYALSLVTRVFSIMCCIFLLLIRGGFLSNLQLENEISTIDQLRHKEREQYEISRENIELINIKSHDLKKRLEQYEDRMIGLTDEEIAEIKNAVSVYDTSVKTGNEILDTILTERSLVCEKNGIQFSCIADGAALSFLSTGDTYSLFANAIDNAMEAVMQLDDPEKRIISLTVQQRMGMASVLVDNYYDNNKLAFKNGLPETTKENEQYHGFGMKSIRMIVEKYDGEMQITADDLFHLAILIPIP